MYKKSYRKRKRSIGRFRGRKRRYTTKRRIPAGQAYGTLVNRSNGVMPVSYITRHTYNTTQVAAIPANSTVNHAYRGNGIWDPDQTGAGTSAAGVSLLTTVYSYNRVYASSIEITICNTGDAPIIAFIIPTRTATALNLPSARFYPYYKEAIIAEQSGGTSVKKVIHFCKTSTIMDISTRDFDLQAAANAQPTQQWYWIIGVCTVDSAATSSASISVRITYYTQWNGLKAIAT